jgi:RNA-binding protein
MTLASEQKKHFRSLGHNLKPVVTIAGKGLTEGVVAETDRALDDHELIKVKVAVADRFSRKEAIDTLCEQCNAELVQEIGKVALLFRKAKEPKIGKSNIR